MKNHIPVLVVGKLSWKSIGIFNPNAFPPELRSTAMNCGDQLALIENSMSNTTTLIESQKNEFLKISNLPVEAQKDQLLNTLGEWKGEQSQIDDILIIGTRIP